MLNGTASHQERRKRDYVLQSVLALLFMAGLLALMRYAGQVIHEQVIVVASLASTAFLVFARPQALPARARNILGGHWLSMAIGGACAAAATWLFPGWTWANVLMGATAVGAATLAMTVTDTEHAPAAGTALAMVLNRDEFHLVVAAVALGSVFLAATGRLLRPWLRDLT